MYLFRYIYTRTALIATTPFSLQARWKKNRQKKKEMRKRREKRIRGNTRPRESGAHEGTRNSNNCKIQPNTPQTLFIKDTLCLIHVYTLLLYKYNARNNTEYEQNTKKPLKKKTKNTTRWCRIFVDIDTFGWGRSEKLKKVWKLVKSVRTWSKNISKSFNSRRICTSWSRDF